MPKVVSLNARSSVLDPASPNVPITLITVTHPALDEPSRLSTDPTTRLSVDPLRYGTRHQGEEYFFVLMQTALPEQGQEAADTVTLIIEIVAPELANLATLSTSPATVDLVQVMSNTPDVVEFSYLGLETKSAQVNTEQGQVSIEIGRIPLLDEPTVRDRMTADRFPGLHRR